jgi:hypothetical protein
MTSDNSRRPRPIHTDLPRQSRPLPTGHPAPTQISPTTVRPQPMSYPPRPDYPIHFDPCRLADPTRAQTAPTTPADPALARLLATAHPSPTRSAPAEENSCDN